MQQLQAAVALHNQGDLGRAEAIYRQVLEVDADNFYALNFCGCVCRERKNFAEGIDFLRRAVSLQPVNPDAIYNLGNIFKSAERWEEAISCYEKTLSLRPEYPEALNNLGVCLKEVERYEHSEIALGRVVEMRPDYVGGWMNLGNTLREQGKCKEAILVYYKAIELKVDFVDAYLNLANLLSGEGELDEAIACYRKVTDLKPDSADAYWNLANLLSGEGELDEAIACYRKVTDLKPDSADAYWNLANLLREIGELDEAIACYRKVTDLKPDFADAYFSLGSMLKDVGKISEAREVVVALRQIKIDEREINLTIQNKTLVLDWHLRKVLNLFMEVELAAASCGINSSSYRAAVKQVDALAFPPLFLGERIFSEDSIFLYKKGYLVDENLVSPRVCSRIISQFNRSTLMSNDLIESVAAYGILQTALERIFLHTKFPHLIWNCIYFAKGPNDEMVSDTWHYDNHYNAWSPKLMIYLNSQKEECGATEFVDAVLSSNISEKSDYMGLVSQRDFYLDVVKEHVEDLNLHPVSLEPEHYAFSPNQAGSGVWFCPARTLHRGVSPKKGVRHILSFSLTPLPAECGLSLQACVDKSIEILLDKVKMGMQTSDTNPYWTFSQADCE